MNTGQIYHLLSVICYVLSALAFGFTVYLFFRYKIINAFNILSGRKLKQDMDRLSHLSGSASEGAEEGSNGAITQKEKKGKGKNKKQNATEELSRYDRKGSQGGYDTEDWGESASASETEELYKYNTEATEELPRTGYDTDELDIVVTEASDTELL